MYRLTKHEVMDKLNRHQISVQKCRVKCFAFFRAFWDLPFLCFEFSLIQFKRLLSVTVITIKLKISVSELKTSPVV